MVLAKEAGLVEKVSGDEIVVMNSQGAPPLPPGQVQPQQPGHLYQPAAQGQGRDRVERTCWRTALHRKGQIGLGRNVLIGFMTREGYNYEDAI